MSLAKKSPPLGNTDLRHRAEARLRTQRRGSQEKTGEQNSTADSARMLHELEVHQIELEMQNAELHAARDRLEATLENYTDLYDFAPVGYFSLTQAGEIAEANLTGAALLGVDRSRLIGKRLSHFVISNSLPTFDDFLRRVFRATGKQVCEAAIKKKNEVIFWASLHGISAPTGGASPRLVRVTLSDITLLKKGEESQRRVESLAVTNRDMAREITRRQRVEKALQKSERHQSRLLEQSRAMQEQLRRLSHQILSAQEEERKRISRELHDEIAQTLVGINIQLEALTHEVSTNPRNLKKKIAEAQKIVQDSVLRVHQYARELRPVLLDDLGLVPALKTFMRSFSDRFGIRAHLTAPAGVASDLDPARRTVLYRVAQEALTNVARHANATAVEARIQKLSGRVRMRIKDNGISFEVAKTLKSAQNKRLGLLGMRERLDMVGGTLKITSAPGLGTIILVEVTNAPPLSELETVADLP